MRVAACFYFFKVLIINKNNFRKMQNKVGFIMLTACTWSTVLAAYCAAVFEIVFPPTVLASRWLEELQVVRKFQG